MELDDTPLWAEAQKIMGGGATSTNFGWQAFVHTPQETLTPINLMSVNFIRSYHDCYGDEITATLTFGLGTFSRRIFPFRDELEVTLRRVPLVENQDATSREGDIEAERFKALLIGKFMSPTLGSGNESTDEDALNLIQLVDVHMQLQDKCSEQLRVMLTGGICRSTNVQNGLKAIITSQAALAKVDAERSLKGVDMVDADNIDVKQQIVITQGTRLIDLPDFIQKRIGVYNAGIGTYIQNRYWYIFPLYDTTDFNRRTKTLTMLVMPQRKLSNIERTFQTKAGSTTILVTGNTSFKDDSGTNYQNYGNGVRIANAAALMDNNLETANNKTLLTRKKNNNEFITEKVPLAYSPMASNRISANPFPSLSQQAAKRGGLFRALWENADHSLLFPGMVVKVVYSDKDAVKEIYGILHSARSVSHKPGGITSKIFKHQISLEVFVNNQIKPLDE